MPQPCSGQLEYQGVKRSSIALASLMLVSLLSAFVPTASATDIVLTDAVQVVDSGTHNDRMIALNADSEGNIHVVWSRNTNHLYYKMLDPRGETLIEQTQISDPGQHRAWLPDVKVDDNDMVTPRSRRISVFNRFLQ